nr:RNA methyltransferase [Actinomyces sp.]
MARPDGVPLPEPDLLDNPSSARVSRVAALTRRPARTRYERFLVEGPQGVREAVRHACGDVLDLYATQEAAQRHPEILSEARAAAVYTHLVTPAVMAAMSTDAQGLLAVVRTQAVARPSGAGAARAPQAAGLRQVLDSARLVAVLTQAQDPGNAGTIIRAADAAGADAVVLARGSVDPTNPKVVRSSAGSLFHLPVLWGLGLEEVSQAVHGAGLAVLAADGRGGTSLFEAEALLSRPTAWWLGNEAHGLSPQSLRQADAVVSIPLYGQAESLNVATAAAVCFYASARAQRQGTTPPASSLPASPTIAQT